MQAVRGVLQLRLRALQHFEHGAQAGVVARQLVQRVDGPAGQRRRPPARLRTAPTAPRARRPAATAHAPGAGARRSARPIRRRPAPACRPRRSARPGVRARAPASRRARARRPAPPRPPSRPATARASAAVSAPACSSSSARTAAGRVRLCQACWPWMSTSCSPASRSWPTVAGLPLIHARLLPCASMLRRSSRVSPPLSKPASSSQPASAGGVSNSAVTSARGAAFAHHAGVAAAAQRQLQRIDQDRLARAGLAGQHREAGAAFHLELADDDHVPERQAAQHFNSESPAQRRAERLDQADAADPAPPVRRRRPPGGERGAEGAAGGGHTTPSCQRSLRRSVA